MDTILRSEHPRPDQARAVWQTLNGPWAFDFDEENIGLQDKWYTKDHLERTIQVPFAYQSELSGINDQRACDVIWYTRAFTVGADFAGRRVLLRFGAVDYLCGVWLDGQYLGGHEGGYTPFVFDITHLISIGAAHRLTVRVEDRLDKDQPRGKQSFRPEPFECWYTPVSGIWQSVWLEGVGDFYPTGIRLTPDVENARVVCELTYNERPENGRVRLTASFKGKLVAQQEVTITDRYVETALHLSHDEGIDGIKLWWPGAPNLYDLRIETLVAGTVQDDVSTYFGMRQVGMHNGKITLNNVPLYQRLVLDQGYWPDGLLTAPSDDALRKDVELTLKMGFNGARKHQKFEDPRYLYWADQLGLIVWGELPSAYWLTQRQKTNLLRDMGEAIARDYNHPAILVWVPVNESWGVRFIQTHKKAQQLADALYHTAHALDGTRLVSGNDGWEQTATDLVTVHDYTAFTAQLSHDYKNADAVLSGAPNGGRFIIAEGYQQSGKPMLISEYGGIAMQKDKTDKNWGYNGAASDEAAFLSRYEDITMGFKRMPFFCGYCYTQLTDVFQEVNGLMDMHRNMKVSMDEVRRINLAR